MWAVGPGQHEVFLSLERRGERVTWVPTFFFNVEAEGGGGTQGPPRLAKSLATPLGLPKVSVH